MAERDHADIDDFDDDDFDESLMDLEDRFDQLLDAADRELYVDQWGEEP